MALKYSTAIRNLKADAACNAVDSGFLDIRTGSQPATGDTAASGTLLASIPLPANAFAAASSGACALNGTWTVTAVAGGTAGWARFRNAGSTASFDVSVTATGGGGDLTLDNAVIVSGGTVTVTSFTYTQPAS